VKLRVAKKCHLRCMRGENVRTQTWKRTYDRLGPRKLLDWLSAHMVRYETIAAVLDVKRGGW
jgi:hypothetical protein